MVSVPIVRPELGAEEAAAAASVVRSGWVMQGPEVAAFEIELAAAVGAAHAVAVSSGTAALHLALRALDIGPGDEVATVSHSFISTANAVLAAGARPVMVDVERDTLGMDPAALERALGPRVQAILCVHQLGIPCDLPAILALAERRGLPVIEDAACALGSELDTGGGAFQRIGKPHGRLACFSFHPRKLITTGEGGMLTTSDPALAARLRLLRGHGMAAPPGGDELAPVACVEPGFNARMTDIQAAIGRVQLRRLDAAVAARRRLAAAFTRALTAHTVLEPPRERAHARSNFQSYPACVRAGAATSQTEVLRFLAGRGISCRGGVTNAHQEPAYRGRENWSGGPFPVSEYLREHTVLLPVYQGMTADEAGAVLAALSALGR